jgi:AraC family transcriptional regulator
VGYSSLGTFTRRFTELVGFSPRAFRQISRRTPVADDPPVDAGRIAQLSRGSVVTGAIMGPGSGPIAIGLFPTALPQGRPVACCLVRRPGAYRITGVPEGQYFVLAVALGGWRSISEEPEFRGAAPEPISVSAAERAVFHVDIQLRPRLITDPPILVSLPVLAVGAVGARTRASLYARAEPKVRRQISQERERQAAADGGRFTNRA